ncbi:hypothetical protein D4R42_00855 [bacterium]|nr:MAG: hypothetical protein D4R42_00855 [bacterium]
MTRSEFFKKIGLGALICAVAPGMLLSKRNSFDIREAISRVGNTARITEADRQGQKLYEQLDIVRAMQEQAKRLKYKPNSILMNINGEVIDVLDKKNRKIVNEYLKIIELP